ncbi:MAG: TRAP transporter small permease [Pseudomonadota bacterium]
MKALLRVLDGATEALNLLGSVLIVGLMVLIGADVIGRGIFASPIPGVPEMVSLSIVAIVFLQAPAALRAGRLTRSDAILTRIIRANPRAARWLESAMDLAAIAVIAVIFNATLPLFQRSWVRNDFVGAIGDFTAPTWPVKFVILVGTGVLVFQFAARILRRHMRAQNDPV